MQHGGFGHSARRAEKQDIGLQQSARHAPQPLAEGHICEIKCLARPLNCSLESLEARSQPQRPSGHGAAKAHASDTTCKGSQPCWLARCQSNTCRSLPAPWTQWARGKMRTVRTSCHTAFGKRQRVRPRSQHARRARQLAIQSGCCVSTPHTASRH